MNIISFTTGNSTGGITVKAELSDSTSLFFTANYLPAEFDLSLMESGRELQPWEEEAFRFADACYKAEKAALKLIARAEQYSLGLTAKLERRGFDIPVAKAVITSLLDRNLLNDARYAELWIRSRISQRKAPSPRWLQMALRNKGIGSESVQIAQKKVFESENEYILLEKYLKMSHYGKTGSNENNKLSSLISKLKYEGFSYDTIEKYFDAL